MSSSTARRAERSRPSTLRPRRCCAEIAEASEADVDLAVKAARRAYTRVWSRMPGAERAKYLYRIARIIQERGREFAVLETIDNGKPIRETRDVDIPLVARALLLLRRLGRQAASTRASARPRPLGVAGQVIPWNFPLLMLAWKIAPALAAGNTVVLKPAETTPLTALLFAEICQQADLPPGVVNIVTGAGETGRALVEPPRRRQGGVHRLDRGRQPIAQGRRRHAARRSPWSSAARRPTSSSTTPRSTRRSRASSTASSSTRATSAAPGRGCWSRSRSPTSCSSKLKRRMATLRRRRPARQEHRHRRDQLRRAADRIRELSEIGEAEGAERWSAARASCPTAASGSRRRCSPASPRRTGSPARRSSGRCCRC